MQTGRIGCAALAADLLMLKNMADVSEPSSIPNFSPAFTSSRISFDHDFWTGLTGGQRATIVNLATRAHARVRGIHHDGASSSLEKARAQDHAVVQRSSSSTPMPRGVSPVAFFMGRSQR